MVERGHSVEWFSASFPGAPAEEELDGIRIVRAGRQWTVHWQAFKRYRGSLRGRFDAVIDEVNTMPFFTPFWARIPTFMLIFQLAREVWWYESPFPISAIGFAIEPLYLRSYRHTPVFTISRSTEHDLRSMGFKGPITLIPIGIEMAAPTSHHKLSSPTFLYVGRLAPSKRIGHMLEALAEFRRTTGTGTLWLAGSGSARYEHELLKLAQRLNLADAVTFWGRVSAAKKNELMAQATALLMTSVREGWGLVVTEAGARGTPAIVYDVPGLRDSVRNELTGLVVSPRPPSLAGAMARLAADHQLRLRLAAEAKRWSDQFSLDESAHVVWQALEGTFAA